MVGVAGADQDSDTAQLKQVRSSMARYHSPAQAERAGYELASPCEVSPVGDGGMGFHYVKAALIEDPAIDPLRPEILLYAPKENGRVELVGVEYLTFDEDGMLGTDGDRPSLNGVAFDGPMPGHGPEPMPGHEPQMPVHYDLHVWLYEDNPRGLFAPWNPNVTC